MSQEPFHWPQIDTPGRRIGYARVSTRDQQLRMQKQALDGVKCDRIYSDHGFSGADASRPGLDRMLSTLKEGDTVVVFKLDRLGRSVLHLSDLLVRFRQTGIGFVSLAEGINTTTPGGKLVYHLFSAFAEFQRDVIVENTRIGLMAAKAGGKRLGRPPLLDTETILEAHRQMEQLGTSKQDIAARLGVSRLTLHRALEQYAGTYGA